MTASTSAAVRPARCSASSQARVAISARTDSSSFERCGSRGTMRSMSRIPSLSITNRDRIPLAFSMNALDECAFGSRRPASISAACEAFQASTHALKLSTSSSFEIAFGGVKRPVAASTGRRGLCSIIHAHSSCAAHAS